MVSAWVLELGGQRTIQLKGFVTLDNEVNLSMPQFPHLQKGT